LVVAISCVQGCIKMCKWGICVELCTVEGEEVGDAYALSDLGLCKRFCRAFENKEGRLFNLLKNKVCKCQRSEEEEE